MRLIPVYAVADFTDALEIEKYGYKVGYATIYVYSMDNTLLGVYLQALKYIYAHSCEVLWWPWMSWTWNTWNVVSIAITNRAPVYVQPCSNSGVASWGSIKVYWQCSLTGNEKPTQQLIALGVFDIDRNEFIAFLRILQRYNILLILSFQSSVSPNWTIHTLQDKIQGKNYILEHSVNSSVVGVSRILSFLEPV